MADTPGPLKPVRRHTLGTVFRLDPEGNVQMTWQTLVGLCGFIVWMTSMYFKIQAIDGIIAEQKVVREVLIERGFLSVSRAP
jgi:hypothetical protein